MDTQWPRYEVFKQDTPRLPHQNVGSVHASDAEIALLNARDVFGRRPSCLSLWVVPARAIFSATAEELDTPEMQQSLANARETATAQPVQTYLVFQKTSQRRSMTFVAHVGAVQAASPQHALALALDTFGDESVFTWWVCPAQAVTSSDPDVVESWFAPANDKTYRQQSYYGHIRRKRRRTVDEPQPKPAETENAA